MGGMLAQPVTDKSSNEGNGLGLAYGLSSMQGWRTEMEDAHDVKVGLKYGLEDWSYFAVFDGHAGKRAAAFAAWNLLEFILRDSQFKLSTENLPEYVGVEPDMFQGEASCDKQNQSEQGATSEDPKPSKQDTEKSDQDESANDGQQDQSSTKTSPSEPSHLSSSPITGPTNLDSQSKTKPTQSDTSAPISKFATLPVVEQLDLVKSAIKSGFLKIDQSMRNTSRDISGCTAVCALISPTHLFIANCGDSRAVLYDGKRTKFATVDHKPLNPKERRRIMDAGGSATQRINGTLAVSRALGDFEFKKDKERGPCEQLVSPEPEVTVIERHPTDQFLVLACDGIWDVMENRLLCQFIEYKLKVESSLKKVCSSVLDLCLHKGSRDNMSIIIVVFENGPKFSEEELARDVANDESIVTVIRNFGEKQVEFNDFFYNLKEYHIQDIRKQIEKIGAYLPPGVGLESKYDLIHYLFVKEFEEKSGYRSDDD